MLSGEYKHSLDAKNRVSIPAGMREELGENFVIVRSLRGACLRFYSASAWKEYIEPLKKLQRSLAEQTFWFLYHDAMETTPDSLGRVRISRELLSFAGVNGEECSDPRNLVIVGCGDYGEIWSEENYAEHLKSIDIDEIRRALEESGL